MASFQIINMGDGLGDCFLIHLKNDFNEECLILVDGRTGAESNGFFESLKKRINTYEKIDYMIITHIDNDHVGGIIRLLQLPEYDPVRRKLEQTIVIYNYVTRSVINYRHAEILEQALSNHKVVHTSKKDYIPYSCQILQLLSFEKRKTFDVDTKNKSCAYLTLFHPDKLGIDEVYQDYEVKRRNGERKPKKGLVNRQSIAFLLEFAGKRVLFGGDGYMDQLVEKIEQLKNIDTAVIDLIKIPHHGAEKNNKGLADFAKKHKCTRFIVTGENTWGKMNPEAHPSKNVLNDLYDKLHLLEGKILTIYSSINMMEYEYGNEIFCNKEEIDV